MSSPAAQTHDSTSALDRLVNREEVLQICYWYKGEGFGDTFDAVALEPFLNTAVAAIESAFDELVTDGDLEPATGSRAFRFTASGMKKGGRLFADSFNDFQKAGHGECAAGCCDGDDHSQCGVECDLH